MSKQIYIKQISLDFQRQKIVRFQTIQFSISTQFKFKNGLIFKNISISSYSV